ncbi:MAG: hypothetical protein SFY67_08225 [Candidatus Melainabacteria bacterium]|nr:hypothetical protein [Candidatus Melainabacteria bacterium]
MFLRRFIELIQNSQEQQLEKAKAKLQLHMWPIAGAKLTQEEVIRLEDSLKTNPKDLRARTLVVGYLQSNRNEDNNQRCLQHQLWIIEHEPRSELVNSVCGINDILCPDAYKTATQLWSEHLKKNPKDPDILKNAASYFFLSDESLAEELLTRGKALRPKDPDWSDKLARLHRSGKLKDAARALKELEESYKLQRGRPAELSSLEDLPLYAFEAGEFALAKKYANKLLAWAKEAKDGADKSQYLHRAFTALGLLELQNKNTSTAKEYLLKSAAVTGSPVLNSFGPNFLLAKELFNLNEKEIVLEYLKLCSKFWYRADKTNVEKWTTQIMSGEFPEEFSTCC